MSSGGTEISLKWIPVVTRDMTEEEIDDMRVRFGEMVRKEDCWAYDCALPEPDEEVIVTTKWGVSVTTFCGDVDGYWFENYEDRGDVLAWTHMPEPYKQEENKNDR